MINRRYVFFLFPPDFLSWSCLTGAKVGSSSWSGKAYGEQWGPLAKETAALKLTQDVDP